MKKPDALDLAKSIETYLEGKLPKFAAAELRRLHEWIEALEMCINNPWKEGTVEHAVLMQVAKAALAKAKGTK